MSLPLDARNRRTSRAESVRRARSNAAATTDDFISVTTDGIEVTVKTEATGAVPGVAPVASHGRTLVAWGIAGGDAVAFTVAALASGVLEGTRYATWLALIPGIGLWLACNGALSGVSAGVIAGRLGAKRLIGGVGVMVSLVAIALADSAPDGFGFRLGLDAVLLFGLTVTIRGLWFTYARRQRRKGRLRLRTMLVGVGDEPPDFLHLLGSEASDLQPVGRITVATDPTSRDALPSFGRLADLARVVRDGAIDCLLVASSSFQRGELTNIRRFARTYGLELRLYTRAPEALASHLEVFPLGPGALVSVRHARLNGPDAWLKRCLDLVGAALGLVLTAPLLGAVALGIKLTMPGPILFRQARVTRGGRTFRIVKFRTMVTDAGRIIDERGIDPSQPFFKPREDELVTSFGRFLRRTSLDELPQLWNVLRGDMSLVGPRPLPADQVAANPELLEARHDVRAGVTGWWQVNGRSEVSPADAVRQDLFYVENWSVWLDLWILLKTAGVVLNKRGAY